MAYRVHGYCFISLFCRYIYRAAIIAKSDQGGQEYLSSSKGTHGGPPPPFVMALYPNALRSSGDTDFSSPYYTLVSDS